MVAQCQVEEGPTYEIKVRGEASEVNYSLDSAIVDFGPQVYMFVSLAAPSSENIQMVKAKIRAITGDRECWL